GKNASNVPEAFWQNCKSLDYAEARAYICESVWPIRGACSIGYRSRRHSRADFGLHMTLDSRLGRTPSFLAPNDGDLSARFAVFVIDHSQRNHCPFVVGVPRVSGYPDGFSAFQYLVVRQRGVVGEG